MCKDKKDTAAALRQCGQGQSLSPTEQPGSSPGCQGCQGCQGQGSPGSPLIIAKWQTVLSLAHMKNVPLSGFFQVGVGRTLRLGNTENIS